MNHAFEFHDGTIHSVRVIGPDAVLAMNVCVHASDGEPGVDAGVSWFQDAEVSISGFALIEGDTGESLDWDASDGKLEADGETLAMVPVPFEKAGRVRIELSGFQGEEFVASGSSIRVVTVGTPGAVERF